MKLTNKFTLWYFAIMLLVLLIGGAIVYYEIQWKISKVEVVRHQRLNDLIAQQIRTVKVTEQHAALAWRLRGRALARQGRSMCSRRST